MDNKEKNRGLAYEALIILGIMAFLMFICRLWPVLLLVILGIFVATLRLLFLSVRKVEPILPMPEPPKSVPTEHDVQDMAFSVVQRRVTELVSLEFPEARWVWATPQAKQHITDGNAVYILLSRAGGYRRALVVVHNLQVLGLEYQSVAEEESEILTSDEAGDVPDFNATEEDEKEQPVNYEYIAFEWVDAHALELNDRCNEAIAQGQSILLIPISELPVQESWPEICRELDRNGIENCECADDGIYINFKQ